MNLLHFTGRYLQSIMVMDDQKINLRTNLWAGTSQNIHFLFSVPIKSIKTSFLHGTVMKGYIKMICKINF